MRKNGFSTIQTLSAILFISILGLTFATRYEKWTTQQKIVQVMTDFAQIVQGLEAYLADYGVESWDGYSNTFT